MATLLNTQQNSSSHCGLPPCYNQSWIVCLWNKIVSFLKSIFSKQKIKNVNSAKSIDSDTSSTKAKVAFISVYGIACGIATYNKALCDKLKDKVELKIFAEYLDNSGDDRAPGDPEYVIRCWSRYKHPKTYLIQKIKEFNPDVIHVGHEYGLFPSAHYFTSLITWLKKNTKCPIVSTMHSVYEHLDKVVQESSSDYIIVHTNSAKDCLVNKGIPQDKIDVIPHGTKILKGTPNNPELIGQLWNTWNNSFTIVHPGFLFDYKGHIDMLHVVHRLKKKYPNVHYIILGSENPHTMKEHNRLYDQIIQESTKLNLEENLTIKRHFIDENILMSFIRTARVCVLPYVQKGDHEVRATSGMARTIIATETPLVTSTAHLFDDLEGITFRAKNADEFYSNISFIFDNYHDGLQKFKNEKIQFLKNTSWEYVANKHIDLYNSYRSAKF